MKKVRFLTAVSCVDGSFTNGDVVLLGELVASQWAASGLVEILEEPAAVVVPAVVEQIAEAAPTAAQEQPAPRASRKRRA